MRPLQRALPLCALVALACGGQDEQPAGATDVTAPPMSQQAGPMAGASAAAMMPGGGEAMSPGQSSQPNAMPGPEPPAGSDNGQPMDGEPMDGEPMDGEPMDGEPMDGEPMDDETPEVPMLEGNFSFFVTSIEAMRELSGSQDGFGGDLGGLAGADQICQTIAEGQGAGHKQWRAFLSATDDGAGGGPVHAIERIGDGPWYDRLERLVAMDRAGLLGEDRPAGDPAITSNLPNERGEPLNQNGADDHDVMTGSDAQGMLANPDPARTCNDWTSAEPPADGGTQGGGGPFGGFSSAGPMLGHSWPARSGMSWVEAHPAPGCVAGVQLEQTGPPLPGDLSVGGGGGYGGIYCFALSP